MALWDVVVVGGGIVGLATCYHLSRMGAKTLLLTAKGLGDGASGANAGRAQVNEGNLDALNIRMVKEGIERFDQLEDELGSRFEHRRLGYICIIRKEKDWQDWVHRSVVLSENGIPTQMMDVKTLKELEPELNTDGLLGAAYSLEGSMNPFQYCWAYARAARRFGAEIRMFAPVTLMESKGQRIISVHSEQEKFEADKIAVMCGAWTRPVLRLAEVNLPVNHTHAEAFITEPLPSVMHTVLGLADFYEIIHERAQAVAIGVGPLANGTLLVTEAVTQTRELHDKTTAWGLSGVARDLLTLYPSLSNARVMRGWGRPTPFTPDGNPVVGWVSPYENLFVGAGFIQTMTVTPVMSEWMAGMILEKEISEDFSLYAPDRFLRESPGLLQ